jgi:hypothetical protein
MLKKDPFKITIRLFIIAYFMTLISCSSEDGGKQNIIGKWKLFQDQTIYTEVWIDKNYAVLIDEFESVNIFKYTLDNDTLTLIEIGQQKEKSFIEKASHLSVVKSVIDGREDKWVSELERILEKNILLEDTIFRIDTSLIYRQKVMKEFAERYLKK